jgi:hypothetical protein
VLTRLLRTSSVVHIPTHHHHHSLFCFRRGVVDHRPVRKEKMTCDLDVVVVYSRPITAGIDQQQQQRQQLLTKLSTMRQKYLQRLA